MLRFFCILLLSVCVSSNTKIDPEEAVKTELKLSLYDLQDLFDDAGEATKEAYLTLRFEKKEDLEKQLGTFFKYIKEDLSHFSDIPDDLREEWLLLNRPGEYALPEEAWNKFVNLSNAFEMLRIINNTKQEISDTLETSRNLTTLKTKWSAWQDVLLQRQNEYFPMLQLLNNASEANEQLNVKRYWEMLSDFDDGYSMAERLWSEVRPLYDKLRAFVKKRLFTYYEYAEENFNETDAFPVYMSGSLLGDDWSNIADIILPRPYLFYDAKTFLHTKSAKQIFQHAETVAHQLNFPRLPPAFWSASTFNHSACANLLLTFCGAKRSEVLTCSSNSWKQYLEAQEIVFEAMLRNMEYETFPVPELRGRVFDEAVVGLGAFFAINAMERVGVVGAVSEEAEPVYQKEPTLLLLTALRVLPKLAFYYAADRWRLEALDGGGLGESWESLRREIQGLRGEKGETYDFLNDAYVTSNKPYLSKFLGSFLQFHIIDYFKSYGDESIFSTIASDTTFYNIVKDRLNYQWRDLISNNFGIEEITADPLLNYFKPLEDYLENAPSDFVTPPPFTTQPITVSTTTDSIKRSVPISTSTTQSTLDATTTEIIPDKRNETAATENEKKPEKPQQHNAGMYVGLAILACVAVVVILVLVRNRMVRRRKQNNRRYET